MAHYHLLTADIGATHSRFAVFKVFPGENLAGRLAFVNEHWLNTGDFSGFRQMLRAIGKFPDGSPFLPEQMPPAAAVIGVAGPVVGNSCKPPNIPWSLSGLEVEEELGLERAVLINDFVAQGHACLNDHAWLELDEIQAGAARPGSPVAVVGAGSGFGKALLLPGVPPRVLPSEGGHADFPFVGRDEFDFAGYVGAEGRPGRIVLDNIVSGEGLAHLYAYMTGRRLPQREVTQRLSDDPRILEWFARFYGRASRNFIVDTLAFGGLFVTGGMALYAPVLKHPAFLEEFRRADPFEDLFASIPVRHVRSRRAGLWGAAMYEVVEHFTDSA